VSDQRSISITYQQSVPTSGSPRGPGTSENGFRCGADVTVDTYLLMTPRDDVFVT